MNALKPLLRRGADLVLFAPDEGNPARRKVNPAGLEIPVPESLAVDASAFATSVMRARTVLIHLVRAGGMEQKICPATRAWPDRT